MTAHAAAAPTVTRDQASIPAGNVWGRLSTIGFAVGVGGLAVSTLLARGNTHAFHAAWLVAFVYFLTIALGSLYFILIHTAMQGGWGVVVRRVAETAAATLPVFAVLFIPVAVGLHELYSWSLPAAASDPLIRAKAAYLNANFFYIRALFYFAVWSAIAWWFVGLSYRQDQTPDEGLAARLRRFSGPMLLPLALTHHFASVDWVMSLDPHWYSTMFGVYSFSGALVSAFAFMAVIVVALRSSGLLRGVFTAEHLHDLGTLIFAFTVFWAYIGFCQYFLIWYGNIPEETIWFKHRLEGGWRPLSLALAIGHFAVPFFFLLSRKIKRNPATLLAAACWMLLMHLLDVYWTVAPALNAHGPHPGVVDVTAFLAVGGFFLGTFGWLLQRHALVPVGDPRLSESLTFETL